MILEPLGFTVACYQTGQAGLEAIRRQPPDLVLLDIILAHPSEGLQVACEMRRDQHLKSIPLILISAIGQSIGMEYGREVCPDAMSADMFLEKPFDAKTLRDAVSWILTQARAGDGVLLRLLLGIALVALSGCAGRRVALGTAAHADPAVKWIFSAGGRLAWQWWMYPAPTWEWVGSAGLVDGRVVLLCNLGAPPEELVAGRLYTLNSDDGAVLRIVDGPSRAYTPTDDGPMPVTRGYAYFCHPRQDGWAAIDLERGTVCWAPPAPPPDGSRALDLGLCCYNAAESADDPWARTSREVYDLPSGRRLAIAGRLFGTVEFTLSGTDVGGTREDATLCQLDYRHTGGMGRTILVADEPTRLIFTWRNYVICVDPHRVGRDG
jgi:CheY-like chemotaxis protein